MASTAADVKTEVPQIDPVTTTAPVATEPAAVENDTAAAPAANTTTTTTATDAPETVTAGASKEEKVTDKEVKITAQPITSGILGYKAPGLMSHLRFSKRFFYLSDDTVDVKDLAQYLRGERPEVAHPTAAYATQTGKGLLFVVKREEDKKTPSGILNLLDATSVTKEGAHEFSFKINGHKHDFQAPTTEIRNGWVVAIETSVEQGKATREQIVGSDSYKESLAGLNKPAHHAVPAAAAAAAGAGAGAGAVAATHEEKKDETAAAPEKAEEKDKLVKPQPKSRSVSRNNNKRTSMFGGLLGKKDEEKTETKAEEKSDAVATAPVKADEPAKEETKPAEGAEVAAAGVAATGATAAVVEHEKKDEPKAEVAADNSPVDKTGSQKSAPKDKKRNSIFGAIFGAAKSPSPTREKKEEEVIPTIKEDAPVVTADAAPADATKAAEVLPAPAAVTEPSTAEVKAENNAVTADAKAVDADKAAEVLPTPAAATESTKVDSKADKRRSMFGFGGPKSSDKEEKGNKLSQMFRRPSQTARAAKDKVAAATGSTPAVPEKDETTEEVKDAAAADKPAEPATNGVESTPAATTETTTATPAIGDVVPEAVSVGHAANTEVQATA